MHTSKTRNPLNLKKNRVNLCIPWTNAVQSHVPTTTHSRTSLSIGTRLSRRSSNTWSPTASIFPNHLASSSRTASNSVSPPARTTPSTSHHLAPCPLIRLIVNNNRLGFRKDKDCYAKKRKGIKLTALRMIEWNLRKTNNCWKTKIG